MIQPSQPSYVSHATNGGPRACSWQLFVVIVLGETLPKCQPCSCSSAPCTSELTKTGPVVQSLVSNSEDRCLYIRDSLLYLELRRTVPAVAKQASCHRVSKQESWLSLPPPFTTRQRTGSNLTILHVTPVTSANWIHL